MTLIGDFIPSVNSNNASKAALDLTYRNSAILLSDVVEMGLGAAGISSSLTDFAPPMPLLGFVYETPSQIELLRYQYSEYPYLNKQLIVNSYVRQNTRFRVRAHRCITPTNTVPINIMTNEMYYLLLKEYCNRGGTFTLATMWGMFSNCVLEGLTGIPPEETNGIGGTSFEFEFLKLDFQGNNLVKKVATGVSNTIRGIVNK